MGSFSVCLLLEKTGIADEWHLVYYLLARIGTKIKEIIKKRVKKSLCAGAIACIWSLFLCFFAFLLRKVVFTWIFWPHHKVKFDFSLACVYFCMECGIVHFMTVSHDLWLFLQCTWVRNFYLCSFPNLFWTSFF